MTAATAYVDLPCGCRLSLAFVQHMCPQHAYVLAEAEQTIRREHERFMKEMRSAVNGEGSRNG